MIPPRRPTGMAKDGRWVHAVITTHWHILPPGPGGAESMPMPVRVRTSQHDARREDDHV